MPDPTLNTAIDSVLLSEARRIAGEARCSLRHVVEVALRKAIEHVPVSEFHVGSLTHRLSANEQRLLDAFEALRKREYTPGVRFLTDELSQHAGILRWRSKLVLTGLAGRGLVAFEPHDDQHVWWLAEHTPKRWTVDQALSALASIRAYAASRVWDPVDGALTERLIDERLGFSERVTGLRIPPGDVMEPIGGLYREADRLTVWAAGPD